MNEQHKQSLLQRLKTSNKEYRNRLMSNELLSNSLLHFLLIFAICANMAGLFSPVLGSNDAYFYAVIAKHIVTNGDWVNLTFAGQDWLDKPHLPFWLTAISYSIFGINSFAYILPGFLCNLLGGYYTYRLANRLYTPQTGLLAAIFYITAIHLLLSSIDVRAEAYLLAAIMAACYYWLLYDQEQGIHWAYLIKGAICTALATMTKGIFVLLPIFSGLMLLWIYKKELRNFISRKWGLALLLSFIFILPELISLYLQFDAHPDKIVFGHTHVSGLKFFFWDSQVGRFLDTGPIVSGKTSGIGHYFFFLHTFLWAFLPWSMFLIAALWSMLKNIQIHTEIPKVREHDYNHIYLMGSIVPTFILFSLTRFQLDHYTNILVPFASIFCASWVCLKATRLNTHLVFSFQVWLSLLLVALVVLLNILLFSGITSILIFCACAIVLLAFTLFSKNLPLNKAIVYPVFAISLTFVLFMLINGKIYAQYDAGYKIAKYLNPYAKLPIVDYQVDLNSLEFHTQDHYARIADVAELAQVPKPYYLVVRADEWPQLQEVVPHRVILDKFVWLRQEKFMSTLFNLQARNHAAIGLLTIFVNR